MARKVQRKQGCTAVTVTSTWNFQRVWYAWNVGLVSQKLLRCSDHLKQRFAIDLPGKGLGIDPFLNQNLRICDIYEFLVTSQCPLVRTCTCRSSPALVEAPCPPFWVVGLTASSIWAPILIDSSSKSFFNCAVFHSTGFTIKTWGCLLQENKGTVIIQVLTRFPKRAAMVLDGFRVPH